MSGVVHSATQFLSPQAQRLISIAVVAGSIARPLSRCDRELVNQINIQDSFFHTAFYPLPFPVYNLFIHIIATSLSTVSILLLNLFSRRTLKRIESKSIHTGMLRNH